MYITREKIAKTLLLAGITLLCAGIIAVILMGVNQFKLGSQLASINQVSNLSHLLVRQQANIFSFLLVRKASSDELTDALDSFVKEDFIVDANIYSPNGVLLARSRNAKELKTLLTEQADTTQQIVEPIISQQALVGFLRVTFDAQYGQTTKKRVQQQFHRLYGKMIILIFASILLASSVYYYFRRKSQYIHSTSKPMINESKTQTQRFHSRRRWNKRK